MSADAVKQAMLCQPYRRLAQHHLRRLPALFTRFTGLFSHVIWLPARSGQWSARKLPTDSRVCRQMVAGRVGLLERCRRCAAGHLATALQAGQSGHRFTCWLGVQNFWLAVVVRDCLVGLAFVQALALPVAGVSSTAKPIRPIRAALCGRGAGGIREGRGMSRGVSESDFREAAKLLRLVIEHVEALALADLGESDLAQAQRAVAEMQTVATRLRGELHGLVPAFNREAPVAEPGKHADRVVRATLERIHEHYSEPVTLAGCAERLGLNPAYLSALFSRQVGMAFKAYLTAVQIEKARELLSDPARTIGQVAFAVGYKSENRFRIAFKKVTGLSPRMWRETFQIQRNV